MIGNIAYIAMHINFAQSARIHVLILFLKILKVAESFILLGIISQTDSWPLLTLLTGGTSKSTWECRRGPL